MNHLDPSRDPFDKPRSEPVESRFEGAGLQPRRYQPEKTGALAPEGTETFSNDLDGQLTKALCPVDPPPGFAATIMELAAQPAAASAQPAADLAPGPKARLIPARGGPGPQWAFFAHWGGAAPRWAVPKNQRAEGPPYLRARLAPVSTFWLSWRGSGILAAAALTACLFTGEQLHRRHQQQQRAALATQQFETATRITDHALDQARAQLLRAGVRLPD